MAIQSREPICTPTFALLHLEVLQDLGIGNGVSHSCSWSGYFVFYVCVTVLCGLRRGISGHRIWTQQEVSGDGFQIKPTFPDTSFSVGATFQVLLAHFLVLMAIICHLRAMLSDPGYVPLPHTNIDFSSDLEKTDSKKKRKVSKG